LHTAGTDEGSDGSRKATCTSPKPFVPPAKKCNPKSIDAPCGTTTEALDTDGGKHCAPVHIEVVVPAGNPP
jgi:hypothetical protein